MDLEKTIEELLARWISMNEANDCFIMRDPDFTWDEKRTYFENRTVDFEFWFTQALDEELNQS